MSFSILTTTANKIVGKIHARMPVILGHNALGAWLAGSTPQKELIDLLQPLSDGAMQEWEVSNAVDHAKNKSAECVNSV